MKHKLEADSIQLEFGLRRILSDIYFKCETGTVTGLLGRNGQGKTCLMNIVYGSLEASSMSVRLDGVSIHKAFNKPGLLTHLPQFNFIPGFLSLKRIFADFNISFPGFINHFPEYKAMEKIKARNLSGGQKRLVEVYIIIMSEAKFSLLDEPFSHLSPLQVEKTKEILTAQKINKGFLITDHLYRQIIDVCDDLYVLADGKMHLTKSIEDIDRLGYAKL